MGSAQVLVYQPQINSWTDNQLSGGWRSAGGNNSWADQESRARGAGNDRTSNFSNSFGRSFDGGDRSGGNGFFGGGDRFGGGGGGWGGRFGGGREGSGFGGFRR
ncbi:MAG TPA: hypothetical protein VHW71_12130 [Steroidobacteraceae bacterium]|nr:hypothetical protein [Steroidobacteraceae bacterium]